MNLKGIILGIVDSKGNSCDIPPSCQGKVFLAPYVDYHEGLDYMRQSKFLFLPQIYDASPRVAMEAMSLNVPLLMNKNIVGGWKYINEHTGEFFTESDFKDSLSKLMDGLDTYSPRAHVQQHYGKEKYGRKLKAFVEGNFRDHASFPKRSKLLIPSEPQQLNAQISTKSLSMQPLNSELKSHHNKESNSTIESFVIGFSKRQFNEFLDANDHMGDNMLVNWFPTINGWNQSVADNFRKLTGGSYMNVSSYKPFEKDQFGPHAAGEFLNVKPKAQISFAYSGPFSAPTIHYRLLHVPLLSTQEYPLEEIIDRCLCSVRRRRTMHYRLARGTSQGFRISP